MHIVWKRTNKLLYLLVANLIYYNYVIVGLSQDSQVTVDMSEEEADMDTAFDFSELKVYL